MKICIPNALHMFYSLCKTEQKASIFVWSSTTVTLHTRSNCMYLIVLEMAQCMKNWHIKYRHRISYHALREIEVTQKTKCPLIYPFILTKTNFTLIWIFLSLILSFFLSLDLFPPTHCRCRGYFCTRSLSMTQVPH